MSSQSSATDPRLTSSLTPSTPHHGFTERATIDGHTTYLSNELYETFSGILGDGRFGTRTTALTDFSEFESRLSELEDLPRARAYSVLASQLGCLEPDTEYGVERCSIDLRSETLTSVFHADQGTISKIEDEQSLGAKRDTSTAYLKATQNRLNNMLGLRDWTGAPAPHYQDRPCASPSTGQRSVEDSQVSDSQGGATGGPDQSTSCWTSRLAPVALTLGSVAVAGLAWEVYTAYSQYTTEQA